MPATSKFQSILLTRVGRPEDYGIYRAGLEWDLTEPIVIDSEEDVRSAPRWREHLQPYHHQVTNLMTFCRRLPVTLLADDVGLGKTISAGLIVSELAARARVSKVLVVCPKLLGPQWKEELETKFGIPGIVATGRELLTANHDELGAVITTYNSARLYLEQLPEDRFDMLILDEAHKLRNLHGVPNPPQVAKKFHKALQDRRFKFVLMLTATPIQNRLWDLYSLVDLLTVARGHENPFGSAGMFARRFIADERDQARQLKADAREEFRSIVYGYMSRVRRGDARLAFPTRVVRMHPLPPTPAELELIEVIREPIKKMNRLTQIGILQALVSSPDALLAQLTNMARRGTAPPELAQAVKAIVTTMPTSAKLTGLGKLIENLKQQNPESWRLVVFTTRRETQTTIQNFLEGHGLKVGIINGDSGQKNQETIKAFRQNPPGYRVIVSTEAGSEGVNLQVANVLVNFDLPWNPMIVEQRIGRIQRLASEHEKVSIFNVMLSGTFEHYIVGRLMEKLQMAAHAIGDIEALLQGTDIDNDGEGDSADSFEDHILTLVLAALAKKDVERDMALALQSIEDAKRELEREEQNINSLLGGMDEAGYVGPRTPKLPPPVRSMDAKEFTLSAFGLLGASVEEEKPGQYLARGGDIRERFRFDNHTEAQGPGVILYDQDAPAFRRLVKRVIASGTHGVSDADVAAGRDAKELTEEWIKAFGGEPQSAKATTVRSFYKGKALLRVRATVAHDSYERLVDVDCGGEDYAEHPAAIGLEPIGKVVRDPATIGLSRDRLIAAAEKDDAVEEFCRFYEERREIEVGAAGDDARKKKKLEDEFTPRLDISLVGLEGAASRDLVMLAKFGFPAGGSYEAEIVVRPHERRVVEAPPSELCSKTGLTVPSSCLDRCEATGATALRHLLEVSEVSRRKALPEFMATCAYSGKRVLQDELETSDVTGKQVAAALMKTSAMSGKRAEPDQFGKCGFTDAEVLKSEMKTSQLSGKAYRNDEEARSDVSGKTGHKSEFITCHETRQTLAADEAETCELTGFKVRPGVLVTCEVTGKRVLPGVIGTCAATGKRALNSLLVNSSISQAFVLKSEALKSIGGNYCLPSEAQTCFWSGQRSHPEDIRSCALTGLTIRVEFATTEGPARLQTLVDLLDGIRRNADQNEVWPTLAEKVTAELKNGKCRVEAAMLSPSKKHLAACAESKTMLGLRVHQIGAVFDIADSVLVGHVAEGKRNKGHWEAR
ncbi:SNF2-related protein [Rhodopseudomonas sp. NSM]|uniref:SNF2-related protein n=1 Tax=Rhodopseudomonas sp. NSM TaxID=3457630 RepID=UPI004037433B